MSKYCRYKSAIYVRTPGKIESINTKYCTYVLNYTNSHPKFSPPQTSITFAFSSVCFFFFGRINLLSLSLYEYLISKNLFLITFAEDEENPVVSPIYPDT